MSTEYHGVIGSGTGESQSGARHPKSLGIVVLFWGWSFLNRTFLSASASELPWLRLAAVEPSELEIWGLV